MHAIKIGLPATASSEVRINPQFPKSTLLRNLLAREGRKGRPRRQSSLPAGLACYPGLPIRGSKNPRFPAESGVLHAAAVVDFAKIGGI